MQKAERALQSSVLLQHAVITIVPPSREEKERRIAQHLEYQAKRKELMEKIAARTFARVYIEPLVPNVYEDLYNQGYFYDVVEHGELTPASIKVQNKPLYTLL